MVGRTLAHCRILEKIGSGGMGDVYLAEDTKLARKVALKVLPTELARSDERRLRFEREAKAVAALNHPNIVTVHSVEESDGVHFITMELVKGKSVAELLPKNGFSVDRFFEIVIPLVDAVAAAHDRNVAPSTKVPGFEKALKGGARLPLSHYADWPRGLGPFVVPNEEDTAGVVPEFVMIRKEVNENSNGHFACLSNATSEDAYAQLCSLLVRITEFFGVDHAGLLQWDDRSRTVDGECLDRERVSRRSEAGARAPCDSGREPPWGHRSMEFPRGGAGRRRRSDDDDGDGRPKRPGGATRNDYDANGGIGHRGVHPSACGPKRRWSASRRSRSTSRRGSGVTGRSPPPCRRTRSTPRW